MRIDNVKINGFGQIKNKEIEFGDGINIVYGENEAGKSTILKFITSALFGISKNKNGKNISDFEKYKPWDGTEFSGKIKYTLENGEEYQIFREFKRKNPVVYNSRNEDISKSFSQNGADIFEEQVGTNETMFCNTAIVQQQEVKLTNADTNSIVQKMSNLVSTGDDNISFKKSMEKLNKMQLEAVGTERSKNKPMNVVKDTINTLAEKKKKMVIYKENVNNQADEKASLEEKINVEQAKKSFLKDVKQHLENKKVGDAELEFEKKLQMEYAQRIREIEEKIRQDEISEKVSQNRKKSKALIGILLLFIMISIVVFVFSKNIVADVVSILPVLAMVVVLIKSKNAKPKAPKQNEQLLQEHEIAEKNYCKATEKVAQKERKILAENKQKLTEISDKYKKNLNSRYIQEKLATDEKAIKEEMEFVQNTINKLDLRIHILENDKANIDEKLAELTRVDEALEEQFEIKNELIFLDTAFNIAKECLENAYEEMKHNISPHFEQKLCEITSNITEGKYENVSVSDEHGLAVEIANGAYMPVDRLSVGTIDEMYLALRLSTLDEIARENLPIIFDESFAYFDDNRLKNVMCYLQDQNYANQIIIFTCSRREEQILNQLKIEYNLISLEK